MTDKSSHQANEQWWRWACILYRYNCTQRIVTPIRQTRLALSNTKMKGKSHWQSLRKSSHDCNQQSTCSYAHKVMGLSSRPGHQFNNYRVFGTTDNENTEIFAKATSSAWEATSRSTPTSSNDLSQVMLVFSHVQSWIQTMLHNPRQKSLSQFLTRDHNKVFHATLDITHRYHAVMLLEVLYVRLRDADSSKKNHWIRMTWIRPSKENCICDLFKISI